VCDCGGGESISLFLNVNQSGIAAIKSCLDEGLKVTCYDKSSQYGGLWCFRPEAGDQDATYEPSVMRTTILNTSKELSAFSDFPPPANLPNFMKHKLYMNYLRSYVKHFNLLSHINLKHKVLDCHPEWHDDTQQVKWLVRVERLEDGVQLTTKFDRLMVAIGHHNIPFEPSYLGQEKFRGEIIHSARLKDILASNRFVDKRVVVVGLGNSACDAANDISLVSEKCYVSCHRGQWFTSRYLASGPYDFYVKSRAYMHLSRWVPEFLLDKAVMSRLEERTNHHMLGLMPKHKPSENVPAINDLFPYKIYTGGVVLKGNIHRITERGVVFEGEEEEECEVDIIVLATGYVASVPFLDETALGLRRPKAPSRPASECLGDRQDVVPTAGQYDLFLNIFAPRITLPTETIANNHNNAKQNEPAQSNNIEKGKTNSLIAHQLPINRADPQQELMRSFAFIGLVQPNGSLTVISELQSRYAARVFAGKLELPTMKTMKNHMDKMERVRSKAVRSHSRDQLIGSYVEYTDTIAKFLGVKPNMGKILFKDFTLWKQMMFGPCASYQYRLTGPGKWAEARNTILGVNERIYCGINEGKNHLLYENRRKCLNDPNIAKRKAVKK